MSTPRGILVGMATARTTETGGRADTPTLLLDTAIAVIAEHGLRGLTHRALQEAAGLKHGSVTYYFKTWDLLVLAVVDRMVEIERDRSGPVIHDLVRSLAVRPQGQQAEPDYDRIAALLQQWWTASRDLLLARFELDLAGARQPAVREAMARCGAEFRRAAELVALAAGSPDPELDAQVLVKLMDGLMLDFVIRPPQDRRHLALGLRHAVEAIRRNHAP